MRTAAGILVVALSHGGHWFAGQSNTFDLSWAVPKTAVNAKLTWRVQSNGITIASGERSLAAADRAVRIQIVAPSVRTDTAMRWSYRLDAASDSHLLGEHSGSLWVYPADLLTGMAARLEGRSLLLCDRSDALAVLLNKGHVGFRHVREPAGIGASRADIVLVGEDSLTASAFSQSAVLNLAESGASVMFFSQRRVYELAGYALARRPRRPQLTWRLDHPLLRDFSSDTLEAWLGAADADLRAVLLPADEPALEIASWPRETPGRQPVPIDALLVVKQIGRGRIVLSQLPFAADVDDPRSHLFLRNALDFLSTRPQPTPPPSRRRESAPASAPQRPTIRIPSGVDP